MQLFDKEKYFPLEFSVMTCKLKLRTANQLYFALIIYKQKYTFLSHI